MSAEEQGRWAHLITDRDDYSNLILLCVAHHKLIDQDPATYTIDVLVEMKNEHERLYEDRVSRDRRHSDDMELRAAAIVDSWERRLDLDSVQSSLGSISYANRISRAWLDNLETTNSWILSRAWPSGYEAIQDAMTVFRLVAQDLIGIIRWYGQVDVAGEYVDIDSAYRAAHSEENYEYLLGRHEYTVALARDLALALTRATNRVCEAVREQLSPYYRTEEGIVLFEAGLGFDMSHQLIAANPENIEEYSGLRSFALRRGIGDICFGEGLPDGFHLPGIGRDFLHDDSS